MANISDGILEIRFSDRNGCELFMIELAKIAPSISYGGECDLSLADGTLRIVFSCRNSCDFMWEWLWKLLQEKKSLVAKFLIDSAILGRGRCEGIKYQSVVYKKAGEEFLFPPGTWFPAKI